MALSGRVLRQGIAKFDPVTHRWRRLSGQMIPCPFSGPVHSITEDRNEARLWVGLASPRILRICRKRRRNHCGGEFRGFT